MSYLRALRNLNRYGYLPGLDEIDISLEGMDYLNSSHVAQAVTMFQSYYGLDTTGRLDEATLASVHTPRCTIMDLVEEWDGQSRVANYNVRSRWEKNRLTWRITKFPSNDLSEELVIRTMERAFSVWEAHADLKFTETDEGVGDIEIRWESGDHGDGDPFDKSGGTLAHAFFPRQGRASGDIHFDDDEFWTLGSFSGINLTQVAVHEIGHSLGLEHTNVRGAIMFPSYEGYRPELDLASDDIEGIQALYGPPPGYQGGGGPLPSEPEWTPPGGRGFGPDTIGDLLRCCGLMLKADYKV